MKNVVFLNGEFLSSDEAKVSAFDHGFLYGDGVYETLRVKNREILFWDEHWTRLQNSMAKIALYLNTDSKKLHRISEELIKKNHFFDARLRITVTRGENHFQFSTCKKPTLLISLLPLQEYPAKMYEAGVEVATIFLERILPNIKSTSMLATAIARKILEEKGVFEVIFTTKEGFLREGSVSNIFVLSGKEIWIAPKKTVLPGTMLASHLDKFQKEGFQIIEKNFTTQDIQSAQGELFLSNSLFEVIKVKSIINDTITNQ